MVNARWAFVNPHRTAPAARENLLTRTAKPLAMPDDAAFVDRLLDWFGTVRRDLPWRGGDDLYGIWISEIMLQQTTVQAVIPYWNRFMARFPTVADLAAAPAAEVMQAWAGLGYYSRARNLHAAARDIVARPDGAFPASREEWAALPGVGPYASGAIASIGLGERVPALDANARRVLARWAVTDPEAWAALPEAARRRAVDALGAELVPAAAPGTWNEALMELGALHCGARRACCRECPVSGSCRADQGGWATEVPPPKVKPSPTDVVLAVILIRWRDRVLLSRPQAAPCPSPATRTSAVRDDFSTLHRGLWGLPTTAWFPGREPVAADADAWLAHLGIPADLLPRGASFDAAGSYQHGITRYRLHASVHFLELEARRDPPSELMGPAGPEFEAGGPWPALFYPVSGPRPPLSRLAEKALHFQQYSGV